VDLRDDVWQFRVTLHHHGDILQHTLLSQEIDRGLRNGSHIDLGQGVSPSAAGVQQASDDAINPVDLPRERLDDFRIGS
jgi:hypothetical protein